MYGPDRPSVSYLSVSRVSICRTCQVEELQKVSPLEGASGAQSCSFVALNLRAALNLWIRSRPVGSFSAAWRWNYPRPSVEGFSSPGAQGPKMLAGALEGAQRRSLEWQREQARLTGFPTTHAELGHAVAHELRRRGFRRSVALYAGHLAAVGSSFNWQGNARIAKWCGFSERTAQRNRAELEAAGLIASRLLLTGDLLPGQRAPVRHPHVVRDVAKLQALVRVGVPMKSTLQRAQSQRRRKPSAAEVSQPVETTRGELVDRATIVAFVAELAGGAHAKSKAAERSDGHDGRDRRVGSGDRVDGYDELDPLDDDPEIPPSFDELDELERGPP